MAEEFTPFDPAELLDSLEAIQVFLADAFETADAAYIAVALNDVVRAKGMGTLPKRSRLSREQLNQSLGEGGNLTLNATLAMLNAVGLTLTVVPTAVAVENATSNMSPEGDPTELVVDRTGAAT